MVSVTLPAGTYWIGDLCYCMSDAEWDEVCALTIDGYNVNEGKFTLKDGRQFVMFNTAYGDGEYFDDFSRSYGVDSGSIGCILASDISGAKKDAEGGHIITFAHDFVAQNDNGVIQFGHITIDTSNSLFDGEGNDYEDEGPAW